MQPLSYNTQGGAMSKESHFLHPLNPRVKSCRGVSPHRMSLIFAGGDDFNTFRESPQLLAKAVEMSFVLLIASSCALAHSGPRRWLGS